ncbi:glycosyl hydrolase family 79 N-terminal domain-containing protein [Marinomonas profundimaris]|uniref:Glycoside hydrolase n=1 Tax=Marinomonas profundimaris TaxID=1208321 RepID=W1RPQ2_9GAMM|nr:glycoside hydrolase [Marinomonas profundimaris]ETI58647.1 glycoside hydrolase [Marinomonas profundimaris]
MFSNRLVHPWRHERNLRKQNKTVSVTLNSMTPITKVDPRFLSFSIDISVLAGGYWWEGSKGTQRGLGTERVEPLDLNQPKLDLLIRALGPAYVRVGGSEADKIHYFTSLNPPSTTPSDVLTLTQGMWNNLHNFCQRLDLSLMFTMKYGLFERGQHGIWQAHEVEALLKYCDAHGQRIDIIELGNELNAYWAFHGFTSQPSAKNLAKDYDTFIRCIRQHSPTSRIAGPGSAFWPRIGEAIKPLSNISSIFLANLEEKIDIVDWHYYPFQSSRSPVRTRAATIENILSPNSFKDFEKYSMQLEKWRNDYQPNAQLWTGETGSAQCGGQAKLSDRFVSCFWWADQLGRGAKIGQKVMVRQSLIGGDYALIHRQSLKPNPDYWVSWLWGKLMGECVFSVQSNDPFVQVYCHSAKKEGKCTLLIINMSPKPKIMHCHGFGSKKKRFEITADSLTSKKIRINGIKPKFKKGDVRLKDFPKLSKLNLVSPYSINFWCFTV